jgi:hypothetical protein
MNRRAFLIATAAALAGGSAIVGGQATATAPAVPAAPEAQFDRYVLPILHGFLRNARATSPDYVVCDYPDGTKLKSCCTPSGKTYVSVARMLPPIVEWLRAGRSPAQLDVGGETVDLHAVLLSIFAHAFDPNHPDFWGYAPSNKATQLTVESALVAHALVRAGPELLRKLSPEQRTNINKWLASCTQVPERKTNHAWFTACNHAARLELSRTFPEFSGDERWMLDDLHAMDELGAHNTADGWYTDSPDQPIYDVYNFYVFPNFPLMWGGIIGARYADWNEKFRGRIRTFLETAPYFFAGNGGHPLMGRSLLYRWAVLSPLVLGYREKLWPHSPGLLRRIVRKQLEYHWNLGCFDADRGKLRETYSADGGDVAREPYVDNGHPYWCMLGNAFFGIPATDPFWSADEEPLPVETGDFVRRFEGPKFLLSGQKKTGEVRWLMSQNSAKRDAYRDKYSKLAWSSHFAYNAAGAKDAVPPDQALVFRDLATGATATRAPDGVTAAALLEDSNVRTAWWARLGEWKFEVVTTVRIQGNAEVYVHHITAPEAAVGTVEVMQGSYAAPSLEHISIDGTEGFTRVETRQLQGANLIHRVVQMRVAVGPLTATRSVFALQQIATP